MLWLVFMWVVLVMAWGASEHWDLRDAVQRAWHGRGRRHARDQPFDWADS